MKYEVIGKNGLEVTPAMKDYAIEKISRLEQYISNHDVLECRVVFKVYNNGQKVEVTIPTKHVILRSEVLDNDIYAALDKTVHKLEGQIKKQKAKTNKIMHNRDGIANFFNENIDTKAISTRIEAQKLVKTKNITLSRMSEEEAINQMEMLGHPFFIYQDEVTGKTKLVYVRDDHDYGVIETE